MSSRKGFVWDTTSRPNPGDISPEASDYYWFEGANENDSKYDVELQPGTYGIEVHGANGSGSGGGVAGYINGTINIDSTENIEIWVGQSTNNINGGWGKHSGGNGSTMDISSFGGGGSTEVIFSNGTLIAAADAGGGIGSDGSPFFASNGGGGGARGGLGGAGGFLSDDGEDAEGTGFGGNGGDFDGSPEPGGQEAGTGFTILEQETGGRQDPPSEVNAPSSYDSNKHGWVKITKINISPEASDYANVVDEGILENGTFDTSVSGLTPDTTYYYRAFGYDGETYIYGDEVQFTTPLLAIIRKTRRIRNIGTEGEGTLTLEVISINTDEVNLGFRYKKKTDSEWILTPTQVVTSGGDYFETLSGLDLVDYDTQGFVEKDGSFVYADILTFPVGNPKRMFDNGVKRFDLGYDEGLKEVLYEEER